MKIFKFNFFQKNGYTVAELLVAISLFIIFFSLASAAFLRAIINQRGLNSLVNLTSNIGLTLEQMAREIRTGYNFQKNLPPSQIQFINFDNQKVIYYLSINNSNNTGMIERGLLDQNNTLINHFPLTSPDISIDNLTFRVWQANPNAPYRITIAIKAHSLVGGASFSSPIFLETTISARILPSEAP